MIARNPSSTCALLIGLCLVFPPSSPGAQKQAADTADIWLGDPGVDIAKARARRQEQKAARLRYEQATTLGDYERIGTKDPRWDADVRVTFEQFAYSLAQEPDAATHTTAAKAPCQRALDAGCKDPLLLYTALRLNLYPAGTKPATLAQLYAQAEQGMETSDYSPLRKLYASFRAAEEAVKAAKPKGASGAPGTDGAGSLTRAGTHFAALLRDPAAQRDSVYTAAHEFLRFAEHDANGFSSVFLPLEKVFASGELRAAGETATGQLAEGIFWTDYAWQGRTAKYADKVTDEGWRLFEERLPKAQAALEKAYALDPNDPHVCAAMVTVELGQGQGRERMEKWFRRAMDADPDDYAACDEKLLYLNPKWYGSAKEMLDFGHQCQATGNWAARLPFILLLAHTELAKYTDSRADYWKQPEVWADVQQLYKAALAVNPDSVYDRSGYALYAFRAEQWKLADELFKALGDKPDLKAMQCTSAQYEQMRQKAADSAQTP